MSVMPAEVIAFRDQYLNRSLDFYVTGRVLTRESAKLGDTTEIIAMWNSLKRHKPGFGPRDIWAFLATAHDATQLPAYLLSTSKERVNLTKQIEGQFAALQRALKANDLDVSIGKPDFQILPPPGVPRQSQDLKDFLMFRSSTMLGLLANRILEVLKEADAYRKGKTSDAVYFSRTITQFNRRYFGQPLYAATAAATNRLFETSYSQSDVRKHMG